jgi:hypothetical protein
MPDCSDEPVQTFQAFTGNLNRMADWLVNMGVKTVAMESTGVYWVPVFEILEERGIEVILVNARKPEQFLGVKAMSTMRNGGNACMLVGSTLLRAKGSITLSPRRNEATNNCSIAWRSGLCHKWISALAAGGSLMTPVFPRKATIRWA